LPSLFGSGRLKKKVTTFVFPSSILNAMDIAGNYLPKTLSSLINTSDIRCSITNCLNSGDHWYSIFNRRKSNKHKSNPKYQNHLALHAKQIPLCINHYVAVNNGTYNGPALRSLKGYNSEDVNSFKLK
jgi:hypothetical protein